MKLFTENDTPAERRLVWLRIAPVAIGFVLGHALLLADCMGWWTP